MTAKGSDVRLGKRRVVSTLYCLEPQCLVELVSGSDLKEHVTFPNCVDHFYINSGFCSKSTNSIPVTVSLTFRNNRIDLKCE
jgi:hypothetical protein